MRRLMCAVALALGPGCPPGPTTQPDPSPVDPAVPPPGAGQPAQPVDSDGWTIETGAKGAVVVQLRHTPVVRMQPVFWGPRWKWAGARSVGDDGGELFALTVPDLDIALKGSAKASGAGELTLDIELEVQRDLAEIKGAGFQFDIDLGSSAFESTQPTTRLMDEGAGWALQAGDEELAIEVSGQTRPRVFFEKNKPNRVRALLVEGDVAAGRYTARIVFKLPSGGVVRPSLAQRYGGADVSTWAPGTLGWSGYPVDLSFLNKGHRPAGSHGRVRARGADLQFADGTPARFWGTNLAAAALFVGDKAEVKAQVRRLSALGYNLVRLHHHDAPWSPVNVFAPDPSNTQSFNDAALEKLDYLIKALKDEGIYIWVDLHVSRQFRRGDAVASYGELLRSQKGAGKGFSYVNPSIEALMARFAKRYLGRRNRYTGLALKDDPAVVGILVTNENDITEHFGNGFLPNKGNPEHAKLYERLATAFAAKAGLPGRQSLQTWKPGPAKIVLAEIQHRFDQRAIKQLKGLGVRAPIATTNYWGKNSLYSLAPLASGDIIDVHSYGKAEPLSRNPRTQANFVHAIAEAQVVGKPLTVTEWNVPLPAQDRFTAPLYVASIAALQGWDALMLYAYNQGPLRAPRRNHKWSSWNDPALTALIPAAALMFRRGDVSRARKTFVLAPSREEFYFAERNAKRSAAIRTLTERSRIVIEIPDVPELAWDGGGAAPSGAERVEDLDRDFIGEGKRAVRSDTGELQRDWVDGVHTVDTPRTQAAAGWLGGRAVALRDVTVELDTPKATVALSALDDAPIVSSRRILVTTVARAARVDRGVGFRAEPVRGRIAVRSKRKLGVIVLSAKSRFVRPRPDATPKPLARDRQGRQILELTGLATHWMVLVEIG